MSQEKVRQVMSLTCPNCDQADLAFIKSVIPIHPLVCKNCGAISLPALVLEAFQIIPEDQAPALQEKIHEVLKSMLARFPSVKIVLEEQ